MSVNNEILAINNHGRIVNAATGEPHNCSVEEIVKRWNMYGKLITALQDANELAYADGGLGPDLCAHFDQIIEPLLGEV